MGLTAILAGIGRMIASVPESKVMDVYNSVGALVDPNVPAYLMSTVKEADAKAAYAALVDFAGVVKANPITASTAAAPSYPSIGPAASKLSAAAYPLIKDVDWTSDLALKPIPGASPQTVMKAVDKMIVMGAAMDGGALKEAAEAHVKAINVLMRRVCCHSPISRQSMQDSEGHCVGTHQQGHGCLQRDERCHRQLPCSQLFVLVGKPPRCAGSIQRFARVQGCGEGGIALRPEWQRLDSAMYRFSAVLQTDGRDAR